MMRMFHNLILILLLLTIGIWVLLIIFILQILLIIIVILIILRILVIKILQLLIIEVLLLLIILILLLLILIIWVLLTQNGVLIFNISLIFLQQIKILLHLSLIDSRIIAHILLVYIKFCWINTLFFRIHHDFGWIQALIIR